MNFIQEKKQFSENKNILKKLEYSFLVERTAIKNLTFPYKSAKPKANMKINRMRSTRWTYHKKWSFITTAFSFLKISVQELFKNS